MKKILYSIIFCFVLNAASQAQSKDERDVTAAVEMLKQAMVDGDKVQLEYIAAPELSYGHSSGKVEDKAAFVDALTSGKSDFVAIDLTEQTIRVIGNTAIVRHILTAKTNDNGTPGNAHIRILLVWQKQQGKWKLIARQAVKMA